ncbi:reversion-inducing cysteine-rich protein with Kazal motifs-like [Oscarella lobularis]|uniref:reversion-inducing cysteine-rich protein with Kazal motifs-like n=1 Tax=Oscarella lobularis TaxID=121494 RepID=UPI00331346D6
MGRSQYDTFSWLRPSGLLILALVTITTSIASDLRPMSDECCKIAESSTCEKQCKRLIRRPVANNGTTKGWKRVRKRLADCSTAAFWSCAEVAIFQVKSTQKPVESTQNASITTSCCRFATSEACRQTCRQIQGDATLSNDDRIRALIGPCGPPPGGDLWRCFLSGEVHPISPMEKEKTEATETHVLPFDGAKLLCCPKGKSITCQDHCIQLFSVHSWSDSERESRWSAFRSTCVSNPQERELTNCIEDVSQSCQLGCTDLNFCRNFNNHRLFRSFRACSPSADMLARIELSNWETEQKIIYPLATIPVDVKNCHYEMWKAIACVFQLKPCHANYQSLGICYDDCLSLLDDCVDEWTSEKLTAAEFCGRISIESDVIECLRLGSFKDQLTETETGVVTSASVLRPCQPSPCLSEEICEVVRNPQAPFKFQCIKGCKAGRMSDFYVRKEDWIKMPLAENPACHQLCFCDPSGLLSHCVSLPCPLGTQCQHNEKTYEHGVGFLDDECALCSCFNGNVTCDRQNCSQSNSTKEGALLMLWVNHDALNVVNRRVGKNVTQNVIAHLERLITTLQCKIEGKLTETNRLLLNVTTTLTSPTPDQINACNEEAKRLASLISTQSPLIHSNPYLSTLSYLNLHVTDPAFPSPSPIPVSVTTTESTSNSAPMTPAIIYVILTLAVNEYFLY